MTTREYISLKIRELEGNNVELKTAMTSPDHIESLNYMYRNGIRANQEKIDLLNSILENSDG